jgi:hypothetical protein
MYSDEEDDENPLNGFWLEGDSLAPPCQAEIDVVHEIINLASPSPDSVLFDLGCGDGRICLEATKRFGCESVGIEIEQHLIAKFNKHISHLGLEGKVLALHEDLRDSDMSRATIIVCYLLPEAIELIKSKLEDALRRGVTLVCNTWGPKGFTCVRTVQCGHLNATVTLLLYDHSSLPDPPPALDLGADTDTDGVDGIGGDQDTNDCKGEELCNGKSAELDHGILYMTYCSRDKRDDKEDLPAVERYVSDRIRRVRDAAAAAQCYFMILSGSYGFLDAQQKIPYYDHLLTEEEVGDMVQTVQQQLDQYAEKHKGAPATLKYFEVQEDPYVGPYKRVVQLICEHYSIDLEIIPTHE